MVFRTAFHRMSSHQTRDFESFTDSSSIPWNPPTIHCPDLTATAPQMSLLSLCALLFRQSHLCLICVAMTYNDSRKVLRNTCQILWNCQCKITFGFFVGSKHFCKLFCVTREVFFYMGRIVTIELPNLYHHGISMIVTRFTSFTEFCDLQLSSHQNFPLWARLYPCVFCKKTL